MAFRTSNLGHLLLLRKIKKSLFDFDEEELRPYFSLDNVIQGVFLHAEKLYGLTFSESRNYPTYHESMTIYEVFDKKSKNFVGLLYMDLFPRKSKSGGAWKTAFYEQGYFRKKLMRPHVSIVCNFTKPTKKDPSLLTFQEVQTLFHEFGHALHTLLSNCHYRSLSGTSVLWDFVELPSQIMENWTLEKESLDLFAKHHQSHQSIPNEMVEKLKKNNRFMAGYYCLRQVNFALLDMAWHTTDPSQIQSVEEFELKATEKSSPLPPVQNTNLSSSFNHIFAGGYAAGYYGYHWAQVLDADAFEVFKEEGIFNPETAHRFRTCILEKGGTEPPMELYKKFRGRQPNPTAFLQKKWFSVSSSKKTSKKIKKKLSVCIVYRPAKQQALSLAKKLAAGSKIKISLSTATPSKKYSLTLRLWDETTKTHP